MANNFDSPVDVEVDEAGISGLTQLAAVMVVALITLAMLNARAAVLWADALEPSASSARVAEIAHRLADATAALGLDRARAAVQDAWNDAKAVRWPDQAPAE